MTKGELISELAQEADLTLKDATIVVNTFFDSVADALADDDKVELRGFGSWKTRTRRPRSGRNPRTGDTVDVPSKRVPYFSPGKELRQRVEL